jgi:hypothetical protein
MHNFANSVMASIKEKNPYMSPSELLQKMNEKVREEIPHKFKGGSARRSAVDDGVGNEQKRTTSKNRMPSFSELDEVHQQVAIRFEKQGVMQRDEYIKELYEAGEL